MKKVVFVQYKNDVYSKDFFKLLSKHVKVDVVEVEGALKNEAELEKLVTKSDFIVITHKKIPRKLKNILLRGKNPNNIVILSEYNPDKYLNKKWKKLLYNTSFFLRALGSNLVIAKSEESKHSLKRIGFPQAGQKLKVIPHFQPTPDLKLKKVKNKSLQIGYYGKDMLNEEVMNLVNGYKFFGSEEIKLVMYLPQTYKLHSNIERQFKQNENIILNRFSQKNDKYIEFLNNVNAVIIPTYKLSNLQLAVDTISIGIPTAMPEIIPFSSILSEIDENLVLYDIAALNITKAISELAEIFNNKSKLKTLKEERKQKVKLLSLKNEVEKWKEIFY